MQSPLKALRRLPGLKGAAKPTQIPRLPELPKPSAGDDLVELWARALDDRSLAQRCAKLRAQYPVGSLPEFVCYDWLTRHNIPFLYQAAVYGGRSRSGGLLPDFVVMSGAAMVWQVQGDYWHAKPEAILKDDRNVGRYRGSVVQGVRIAEVVELWEARLIGRALREQTLRAALAGQSLGRA